MSAIAGAWDVGGAVSPIGFCRKLLKLQAACGPHGASEADLGSYAAGRCLYRTLPEDAWDRQPLTTPDGRYCLVADVRLDEREYVAAALGWDRGALSQRSDSHLLFGALLKWGEDALHRVYGDYAFGLFDRSRDRLLLARDTAGEKPLHYYARDGFYAFASMPNAIVGAFDQPAGVNSARLARFVADLPSHGSESFLDGVHRLEPGHLARIGRTGVEIACYWHGSEVGQDYSPSDDGEALRHQLDAAVARRARRASGQLATHLSSGFDSSAVTSSAAAQLSEPVLAFTAAPATVATGPILPGRNADESALAASTARLHGNIVHTIVRTDAASALDQLHWCCRLAGHPVVNLFNNGWWQAIHEAAAGQGATVLLTGERGNFGLSAGRGLGVLRELIRAGDWGQWLRESRLLAQSSYNWKNVISASFGGYLPRSLYQQLSASTGSWHPEFLRAEWRERLRAPDNQWDRRPPLDPRGQRWEILGMADPGPLRKIALVKWGIDERDPTGDRRLLELCFSLPPSALLKEGQDRPVLRRALAGRVSAELLSNTRRGLQSADWHMTVTPALLRAHLARVPDNDVVDRPAMLRALEQWPAGGWNRPSQHYRYAVGLMRAISACHFAAIHSN